MDQLYLNNVSNIFDPAKNILVYLFLIKWYHLLKIKLVSFKRNKTNDINKANTDSDMPTKFIK